MYQEELFCIKYFKKVLILIFMIFIIPEKQSRNLNHNYTIPKIMQTTLCSERNIPGLICESCDRLAFCIKLNGNWKTYPVEPCDVEKGKYCNIYEGKCSNSPGPCNRLGYEGNFPCTSDGIFPDPYDCQIYHMCYQAEPDVHGYLPIAGTAKCEANRAYSVTSNDCSLTLNDAICKKQKYSCNFPGESSSWADNPNIFYICQPGTNSDGKNYLYPTLYRCAPDEIYNNMMCLKKNNTGSTIKDISPETTEKAVFNINCKESFSLTPDPSSCYSYYYCIRRNGPAIHQTCPLNTYFNRITLACTFGSC